MCKETSGWYRWSKRRLRQQMRESYLWEFELNNSVKGRAETCFGLSEKHREERTCSKWLYRWLVWKLRNISVDECGLKNWKGGDKADGRGKIEILEKSWMLTYSKGEEEKKRKTWVFLRREKLKSFWMEEGCSRRNKGEIGVFLSTILTKVMVFISDG